jgi:hypothetical protein
MSEGTPLNIWDTAWELDEATCPCDVHLIEWLDSEKIRDATLFHFGTGAHHHVGIENARPERRNSVLGITAAPQEYETYVNLVAKRPDVLRFYNVVFGDIYLLNEKLLPMFDVVTLFHLCEFRSEKNDAYDALTDLQVATLLVDKTRAHGHILFYVNSFAFNRQHRSTKDVLALWERECEVERVGSFKTLLVYRKKCAANMGDDP